MSNVMSGFNGWVERTLDRARQDMQENRWDYCSSELEEAETFDEQEAVFLRHNIWVTKELARRRERMNATHSKMYYAVSEVSSAYECIEDAIEGRSSIYTPDFMPSETSEEFVYIMTATESKRVKIGVSKDPQSRLKQVQTGCPERVELSTAIPTLFARSIESGLHTVFADKRVSGEWFNLDADELGELNSFAKKCTDLYENFNLEAC